MNYCVKQRLDRIASRRQGPRSHTQNLNRHLDSLEEFGAIGKPLAAEITRSPGRCLGCGHQLGHPHAPGCALAMLA